MENLQKNTLLDIDIDDKEPSTEPETPSEHILDTNYQCFESIKTNHEQGNRARKLFAAIALAALNDAVEDHKKYGNGDEQIARWARSKDGCEILSCAGINPNERVVKGLMEFVRKGVRTSIALSREESERKQRERELLDGTQPQKKTRRRKAKSLQNACAA